MTYLLAPGTKVEIRPNSAEAHTFCTFQIVITLGSQGLKRGDSIGIVCGSNIDRWHSQFSVHHWGQVCPWQTSYPKAANYLTVRCSRTDVNIRAKIGSSGAFQSLLNRPRSMITSLKNRERYVLELIPEGTDLEADDKIIVTWGDTSGGGPGTMTPILAARYHFLVFQFSRLPRWDRDFPQRRGRFDEMPSIRIIGKKLTRFHVVCQPLVGKGEAFSLHVSAIDEYGNLDENFCGRITIRSTDPKAKLPESYQFEPSDRGSHRFQDLRMETLGWQSITVQSGGYEGVSNMIRVSAKPPRQRIYFGDMHAHTLDCDGVLIAEDHFNYAINTAGLDFGSLSSHSEYFGAREAWEKYLKVASKAYRPGRFVSFWGYEWAGEGHSNVYFRKRKDVINIYGKNILYGRHPKDQPPFRVACTSQAAFVRKLKRLGVPVLAIAHYHTRFTDSFDDQIQRLIEVYSSHSPRDFESTLPEVLSRGLKLGVVCGSDSHHFPLGSLNSGKYEPFELGQRKTLSKHGLQAVFSPSLTRKGIWEGMWNRHTYGTTGARIVLALYLKSATMGEDVELEPGEYPHFKGFIGGTAVLRRVVLRRWDGTSWTDLDIETSQAKTCEIDFIDHSFSSQAVYYLKVVQEDEEKAYSSPIWVKAKKPA